MPPISNRLLIHTVELHINSSTDGWGNEVDGSTLGISKVRLEPSFKMVFDQKNQQVQQSAVLIVDAVKSRPPTVDWFAQYGHLLDFDGKQYKILGASKLYDATKFHHWEVMLG